MEMELNLMVKLVLSVICCGVLGLILHIYGVLVVKPRRMRSRLQNQGIRGPSPSFLLGNINEMRRIQLEARSAAKATRKAGHADDVAHDWPSTVFSYLEKWRNQYGPVFMYSTGVIPLLCVTDIDIVKEMSLCTSLTLGKPSYLCKDRGPLLGQGILSSSGPMWAHQRKIIAPEFYLDKVKGAVKLMVDATIPMLQSWESRIINDGGAIGIRVDEDLRSLSADIISRASFGSNYSKGEEIFLKLKTLQRLMSKETIGVPVLRYLPSKNKMEIWKLEKEIDSMILNVVKQRIEGTYEKDLLQMILEGAKTYGEYGNRSLDISQDKFMVDNCKNIYFAGHETTAITASWSLVLLAAHQRWQARCRAEVHEVCKDSLPDPDMLRSMKTLTMVIQETLRLYPPAVFVIREALQEDISFKGIQIPKGMNIQIPIPMIQQSVELWGSDAQQFNPERFSNGILGACKFPQAYIPFGIGPRTCLGQHFAMTEVKVVLCLILSKFSFSLSSEYHHLPAFRLVVEPENGVYLQVKKI